MADVYSAGFPCIPGTFIFWCSDVRFVSTLAPVHSCAPAPTVCIAGNSFPTILTLAEISQPAKTGIPNNKVAPNITE